MTNLIVQVSRYLIIILMALYTFQCYTVFRKRDEDSKNYLFLRQNMLMFFMHFVAFTVLFLELRDVSILFFYGAQVIYLAAVLVLFRNLYPLASRLLINNMCMLQCISFIMLTRLSPEKCIKQFKIAAVASVVALLIPFMIRKLRFITKIYWLYALMGIGLLALVAIAAQSTYGAKLSFSFGGISVQPSEFVKIIYVFAIAGLLSHARDFKRLAVATGLAALHVLILVVSKDLGSAVIFFVTYLVMLFVSTKNPFYVLAGILAGALASIGAYYLFSHIRVRIQIWQNPFRDYQGTGYQVCQSLFAISAGGWFGTGLCQGSPDAIPIVELDFMFSAIAEELGTIFGICLILVCMSCFIMFVNIAMQLTNRFYRLVAVGLGTTYAVQIFLTVGGGIKLIPMTGVTLPLVSYGGSSVLSTLIMFAIVQGLYILQRDEERKHEEIPYGVYPPNPPYQGNTYAYYGENGYNAAQQGYGESAQSEYRNAQAYWQPEYGSGDYTASEADRMDYGMRTGYAEESAHGDPENFRQADEYGWQDRYDEANIYGQGAENYNRQDYYQEGDYDGFNGKKRKKPRRR